MSICEKENKLFCEWKGKRAGFVSDGVVCEKAYSESNPKIVIILKEPNGGDGGDIHDWLRCGGGGHTWNNISRWVYGIRNREAMPAWREFPELTKEFNEGIFKNICAMNLKKSAGGGSTDYASLKSVATEDDEFIKRQYEIYEPDLTICCGSGNACLFKKALGHDDKKWEWKDTTRGVWWYETDTNKYAIDFYHPAARIESSLLLYRLIDAVNEIYKK